LKQLIPASASDFDFFYRIKSEDKNMKWTGHSEKPIRRNLENWFLSKLLENSDRKIYIYFINEIPIGYSYVINETNYIETAVAISEKFEGFGYGQEMVKETMKLLESKEKEIIAWIFDDNIASIRLHQNAGYIPTKKQKQFDGISKMTMYRLSKFK